MLKLRSSARATDSGKSASANVEIVCAWPSSSRVKSPRPSPVTGPPFRSPTAAYTSTAFTPDRNWAWSAPDRHKTAAKTPQTAQSRPARGVIELRRPSYLKGFTMLGRVGLPELIIILMIIILIFGANRLPDLGKSIGKGIPNLKEATHDGENDKSN